MRAMETMRVLFNYARSKSFPLSTRDMLERWQEKHLKKRLDLAARQFPFYMNFRGRPLQEWPRLDKNTFLDAYQSLNRLGISYQRALQFAERAEIEGDFKPFFHGHTIGVSSGTSGRRLPFIVSHQERCRWAGVTLAKVLKGPLWKSCRVAFIFRSNSNLYDTIGSSRINFDFYDLKQPVDRVFERLERRKCDILVAPANMLDLLAQETRSGKLSIQPRQIISVAEVLSEEVRKFVGEVFQTEVDQIYQAAEGFLGVTCRYGKIHLNEDLFVVEKNFIDPQKTYFIPTITDFFRTSQSMIRYTLNDILHLSKEPCPCGSPLTALDKIEGRTDDIFLLPKRAGSKKELVPIFPDFVRECLNEELSSLVHHVVQKTPDKINVIAKKPFLNEQKRLLQKNFERLCSHYGVVKPDVSYVHQQDFDHTKKYRRIFRSFNKIPEGFHCRVKFL